MLAELSLTPSVFDQSNFEDVDAWLEQLDEIGAWMTARASASPILIADVYGGSWSSTLKPIVDDIQDHRAKSSCQHILKQLKSLLVNRPIKDQMQWPGEDEGLWIQEAISSSADEPIERIIATPEKAIEHGEPVRGMHESTEGGFWSGIAANGSVAMRIADQVSLVRKICIHSDFVAVLSPHFYGASGGEVEFAKALISSTFNRPQGFSAPKLVQLHTEGPQGDPADPEVQARIQTSTANLQSEISKALRPGQTVELLVWRKLLHRYVFGGNLVSDADGNETRVQKICISFNHFARLNDNPATPPSPWNLLNKADLLACFKQYFSGNANPELLTAPIVISR